MWVHALLVSLLVGTRALLSWLAVANVRHSERAVRQERDWLRDRLGLDDPERALRYLRARSGLAELRAWTGLFLLLVAVYGGLLARATEVLRATVPWPLARGMCLLVGVVVAYRVVVAPFSAFESFVVDAQFDFDRRTPAAWARDALVSTALLAVLAAIGAGATLAFAAALPAVWWVAAWLFAVVVVVALRLVYPWVVVPLFADLQPVEDGDLRETVAGLFERAGHPAPAVYLLDASDRSGRLNAYVTGLGRTKRVVLYDTLVDELDDRELEGVLAHELAHLVESHFSKGMAVLAAQAGLVAALVGYLFDASWLAAAFGLPAEATAARLFVALLWAYPVVALTTPVRNRLFVRFEGRADEFAADAVGDGRPLADALCRLADRNLSNPFPHPVYAAFHRDHPTIPERLRLLDDRADD